MRPTGRRDHGFTLLEMLVVLMLTGMVTGLLMGGLQQVMRLQRHFSVEAYDAQQGAMQAAWFRQTVNGLVPSPRDAPELFRGRPRRMAGITLAPLDLPEGTSAHFEWRLQYDRRRDETALVYGEAVDAPPVLVWRGDSGRFEYFDAQGTAHESWPPFLGQWPQIPAAIRLNRGSGEEARTLVAVPKGPIEPALRLRDVEA